MVDRNISPYTDFLYSRPSFLEGVARVADFFGALQEYNVSSSPEAADLRAMRADWLAVGDDLRKAILTPAKDPKGHDQQ